jgi:hypothetical protein
MKSNSIQSIIATTALVGMTALAGSQARAEDMGLPLHGFADVNLGGATPNTPIEQRQRGFSIGTVDLYLAPEFDGGVKSLIEIAFEGEADKGGIAVDVERLQVGYTFNDYLTLWAGRFHTSYGYWNNAFHHGAQLQTSIYRPRFLDFEDKGGILPAHSTGLWAKGQARIMDQKLVYNFYVANGSRIVDGTLDMNQVRNDKDRMMVGGSVALNLRGALDGLQVGVHALSSEVDSYNTGAGPDAAIYDSNATATSKTDVMMTGGFLVYDAHDFEVIGEYYNFANKDISNSGAEAKKSYAAVAQVGYAVREDLRPYVRYERANLDQTDSYFSQQTSSGKSYKRTTAGLRYDLNPKATVKAEYLETSLQDPTAGDPVYKVWQMQYAIRF